MTATWGSYQVYWAAPATMVTALLAGLLLALGHHGFYASLEGSEAPTGYYSCAMINVSRQQFNTAVGTLFASLVKATLALAVSTAYVQAFWRSARTSKKGESLSTLNTTFSVLANAVSLVKVHVRFRYPLLLLLAIIAWYSSSNVQMCTEITTDYIYAGPSRLPQS